MKKNVGNTDKLIRYLIAIIAIVLSFSGLVSSPWTYVLYALAVIMILTAFLSTCPIWLVTGFNTRTKK